MSHPPPAPLGVSVTDLTLRYGATTALDRLSLTLRPGTIYGLIGRNGSGKTSFLSLLAAFRRPTAGTIRVEGQDPFENERLTRQICLIRESGDMFDSDRCDKVLGLARTLRPYWDQEYADHLVERFALPLRKTPSQLSRGQRSALGCILGLASRAPLTILSTHLIEEFATAFEEVVMIHNGRLLMHDETDAVRARGAAITGPADAVDRAVAGLTGATGVAVLNERRLGGTKSATVHGPLTEAQRNQLAADGLLVEPVPLQDLFVHLTAEEALR